MTKQELTRFRKLVKDALEDAERANELRETMLAPSIARLTGMPKVHSAQDKLSDEVTRFIEATEKVTAAVEKVTDEYIYIESCINQLEDPDERRILKWRYLSGLRWEKVCDKVGLQWAQTHRKHQDALRHILPIK